MSTYSYYYIVRLLGGVLRVLFSDQRFYSHLDRIRYETIINYESIIYYLFSDVVYFYLL